MCVYIYIYIYLCVRVSVCACLSRIYFFGVGVQGGSKMKPHRTACCHDLPMDKEDISGVPVLLDASRSLHSLHRTTVLLSTGLYWLTETLAEHYLEVHG